YRPAPPPSLDTAGIEHDPDRLLSDTARAALRRHYSAKRRAVPRAVSLRIVDALHARRVSLHPFDYLALTELLATNDAALDRNARLWRSLQSGGGGAGAGAGGIGTPGGNAAAVEDADDDNWNELRPAQRAAYLRKRRRQDPDAARTLLAATIASETATVRRQLLETMTVALSAADAEFLRSLATDRAESVRTLARVLVASIP